MKKIFKIIVISFLIANLAQAETNNPVTTPALDAPQDVWVNVFVHGIVRPVATIGDMVSISHQNVNKTRYKQITRYVRKNSFTHRTQASQGIGLIPIELKSNYDDHNGARAMVATFKKLDQHANLLYGANINNKELYYTYGWSGLLCYNSRQKASLFLHQKLIRLVNELKAKNLNPKLRILAFSHGGNVAVQMANFDPWSSLKSKLSIDELITLGMPVHRENDVLIRHPMFKKVYHFYSVGDIPQTLDFVSTEYAASHRRYQARPCFEIPEKLTQIQVQFSQDIARTKPFTPINKYRKSTYNPSHVEMWSFGWSPQGYNRSSPLFPFPTVAFAPYIINAIRTKPELGRNLIAEIYPTQEKITITDLNWDSHRKMQTVSVPFLAKKDYNELKQVAWTRRPLDHNGLIEKQVVNEGIRFATRQRKLQSRCATTIDCKNKDCSADCKIKL